MTRQIPLLQRRGSEARGRNSSKGRRALHRTLPDARDERISKKELEDKICVEQRDVPLNASLRCTDYVNINEIINRRYVNVGPRTSIVGRGQFSRVYRMIDCTNGKLCAIKEINLRSASNKTQAGAELDFIMKMKSHRMSHQNIITFKHTLMSPTNVSIVMEYASLGSLQDLIDSSGASPVLSSSMDSNYVLPMEWISSIGKAIFSGLHFLHSEQNCTHGDVKPSNILLFKDGQIKLSDFGCCREIGKEDDSDGNGEESRSVCGTLAFMSPEQLLGSGPIGPESDVFSAGLTIMECIESSDQDRCGETFWDVVDVIEMRTKAVVKRADLPRTMRSFFEKCFAEEDARPAANYLLQHSFLQNAKSTIENDATLRSIIQSSSPLPRVTQQDMQLAVGQVKKRRHHDSATVASMTEDLKNQLQPFAHDQQ